MDLNRKGIGTHPLSRWERWNGMNRLRSGMVMGVEAQPADRRFSDGPIYLTTGTRTNRVVIELDTRQPAIRRAKTSMTKAT